MCCRIGQLNGKEADADEALDGCDVYASDVLLFSGSFFARVRPRPGMSRLTSFMGARVAPFL